jgi:hypothetical protein
MAPNGSIWRATYGFWTEDSSMQPIHIAEGDLVREGHEVLQNNRAAFEPYEPRLRFDGVEEATNEPTPRRRGRPPRSQPEPVVAAPVAPVPVIPAVRPEVPGTSTSIPPKD